MKLKRIILQILSIVIFLSCDIDKNTPEDKPVTLLELDETRLIGQLYYAANPFALEEDTILCVKDVKVIYCKTYDTTYCTYLINLFSTQEGTLYGGDTRYAPPYGLEFVPTKSTTLFYPIQNGQFISIMDFGKGCITDSIILNTSSEASINLITSLRAHTDADETHIYMGDYVCFDGNDHMQPKFISDTLTLTGEQIICVEYSGGPYLIRQSINGQTIKF